MSAEFSYRDQFVTAKRFTADGIAAEVYKAVAENVTADSEGMADDIREETRHIRETLVRFAALPHYDEVAA